MALFFLFITVPIIEIALFIEVGGAIGLWPTLLIVVATAVIGTSLVRAQGMRALGDLRASLRDFRDPTEPLAHGAMILVAGVLLLTPGFFTDTIGLLLLLPPVRRRVFAWLRAHVKVESFGAGEPLDGANRSGRREDFREDFIDGEFEVEEPPEHARRQNRPSGWTRH